MGLDALGIEEQLASLGSLIDDPRGAVPTGFEDIDKCLEGGGFGFGELVVLGGRTGTRKTTAMLNLIVNMLRARFSVGVIGLDEPEPRYISKLMSAVSGVPMADVKDQWHTETGERLRAEYHSMAQGKLVTAKGAEPSPEELDQFLLDAENAHGVTPDVLFIDYLTLLYYDKYHGAEVNRIPRLVRDLQTWTHERSIVTVVLHQVGRSDEGGGHLKYHGHTPMTLEQLKYGGEEHADIVLGTYRPSKDPIGTITYAAAVEARPQMKREEWERKQRRAVRFKEHTFFQLLKNRPGVHLNEEGVPLRSIGTSMRMVQDTEVLQPWQAAQEEPEENEDYRYAFEKEAGPNPAQANAPHDTGA